jgi:hypothetical protein
MLESMLLNAVEQDPAMKCIAPFWDCVSRLTSPPKNQEKSRVQAFLASRPKPGLSIGAAAEAGYWNFDSPVYAPIKTFLQGMVAE